MLWNRVSLIKKFRRVLSLYRATVGIGATFQIFCVFTIVALIHDTAQRFDAATTSRCCHDIDDRSDEGLVNDSSSSQRSTFTSLPDELDTKLIGLMNSIRETDCAEIFLRQYEKFCEKALVPADVGYRSTAKTKRPGGCNERHHSRHRRQPMKLCPCVPWQRLLGLRNPSTLLLPAVGEHILLPQLGVDKGGHWLPRGCIARQRIAIIIPFRDRGSHLQTFLRVLHPMLQRQLVEYTIFVVEQFQPTQIFNKASVMNAGFLEVRALGSGSSKSGVSVGGPFDCYVFHDVDMLPEDDRNFYGCGVRLPRHVGAYINKYNYRLRYLNIFGGATSFRPEVFELVNGFSNEFYGWGGEDDDMFNRIVAKNLTYIRFPKCVARYSMIRHAPDKRNAMNKRRAVGTQKRPHLYDRDGLNTVRYKLVSAEQRPLYTWLLISLPPAPR